jgi:hypothetical protein
VTTPEGPRPTALDAISDLLGLKPLDRSTGSPSPAVRLGIVAGRSGPRFLVPLDHPRAAPEACLAYLALRDVKTQITRGAVGLALRFGAGSVVVREVLAADTGPGSLLAVLAELLQPEGGPSELAVAVGLPRVDEVWKPTLQVFHPDGSPAAFVKVGSGPVAAQLVRTEAATLARWQAAADPRLVVPGLLAELEWRGMPIAVVEPLPADARRLPPGRIAANPVRQLDGAPTEASLEKASWWTDRREAEAATPATSTLLERIERRHRSSTWRWARWHGDWVPWNLGRCQRGLVAWDWEYSEPGAPVGLDEVHGAYQLARVARRSSIDDALAAARLTAAAIAADDAGATWLADAHVAMLVTRGSELGRLLGTAVAGQRELLAAAERALNATEVRAKARHR